MGRTEHGRVAVKKKRSKKMTDTTGNSVVITCAEKRPQTMTLSGARPLTLRRSGRQTRNVTRKARRLQRPERMPGGERARVLLKHL